jgi:hypothetical protein
LYIQSRQIRLHGEFEAPSQKRESLILASTNSALWLAEQPPPWFGLVTLSLMSDYESMECEALVKPLPLTHNRSSETIANAEQIVFFVKVALFDRTSGSPWSVNSFAVDWQPIFTPYRARNRWNLVFYSEYPVVCLLCFFLLSRV